MEFKVRVFLNNQLVPSEDLHKIKIRNPGVDMIVNDVVERNRLEIIGEEEV